MHEFAEFEKLSEYCTITDQKLESAIFGPQSFVESVVAEIDGAICGYSIFYKHFASFRGQTGFYLEDVFVSEKCRGQGLGAAMLKRIAKIAAARGYVRIDFQVLDWNTKAVDFYFNLGAERNDSERHFRIADSAFTILADIESLS